MACESRAAFSQLLLVAVILITRAAPAVESSSSRELHSGWRFSKGEQEGAEAENFDDSKWSVVRSAARLGHHRTF